MQVIYKPDEPPLFDYGETQRAEFEPHAGIKNGQFWDLPCISMDLAQIKGADLERGVPPAWAPTLFL